jgi:hypothetical protein
MRAFIICTPHQINERLEGYVARMRGDDGYMFWKENLKARDNFGVMRRWGDDIKKDLKEYDGIELTGLIWLRIEVSGVIM